MIKNNSTDSKVAEVLKCSRVELVENVSFRLVKWNDVDKSIW